MAVEEYPMSFENFYEETDKADRRWRKCVVAAALLFVGYWSVGLWLFPDAKPVEESPAVNKFDKDESLRRVFDTCDMTPRPEKFYFSKNTVMVYSSELMQVQYTFRSDRSWSEILPVFLISMEADGWQATADDKSVFVKENQTVAITHGDPGYYEILCSEKP